jgi:hypothetical protein
MGYQLSKRILTNVTALGAPSRGLKNAVTQGLLEYQVNAPVAYVEIDFHDSVAGCEFLLGNKREIAIAFVNAIYAQAVPIASTEPAAVVSNDMLTVNFARYEFGCDCGGKYCNGFPVDINMDLVRKMQQMRDILKVPIIITSGVRCERRNAEVGGVPNSKHKKGLAVDCYISGMNADKVRLISKTARQCGMDTIEYFDELFVHCEI